MITSNLYYLYNNNIKTFYYFRCEIFLDKFKIKCKNFGKDNLLLLFDVLNYIVEQGNMNIWVSVSSKKFLTFILDILKSQSDAEIQTKLLQLIQKVENNWEFSLIEKARNEILKKAYEEQPNIDSNCVNADKNINKQISSEYQDNNIIIGDENIISNKKKLKLIIKDENNKIIKLRKILLDNSKIIEDNLCLFKNYFLQEKTYDNFKHWEDIDNLFLNKKIQKLEIFKSIIEASKYFIEEKDDIQYFDNYIKIIFEYYYSYLNKKDINAIDNEILEELSKLSDEQIRSENKYIIDIWIIIIYYLLQNKIITMKDFNYFSEDNNDEIKKNIFIILNQVCCYKLENKKTYLKELENTKFMNINKNIFLGLKSTIDN